jgi:hypothetical protein
MLRFRRLHQSPKSNDSNGLSTETFVALKSPVSDEKLQNQTAWVFHNPSYANKNL